MLSDLTDRQSSLLIPLACVVIALSAATSATALVISLTHVKTARTELSTSRVEYQSACIEAIRSAPFPRSRQPAALRWLEDVEAGRDAGPCPISP